MSDITIVGTEVFKSLSPADKVIRFNELEALTSNLSGEWLEDMFQSKVYQDFGHKNFRDFVNKELSIGHDTSDKRRRAFKKTLSSVPEIRHETEEPLNLDFIEADIIEQLDSIPQQDQSVFKKLSSSDRGLAVEAVVETGKKNSWVLYNVTGKTRKWIIDNADRNTMAKYADAAHAIFSDDRCKNRRWENFEQLLKEENKLKRKKEAKASEDAIPDRDDSRDVAADEPEQEQGKINYATIVRGVLDTLDDNGMSVSSFRKALSKEIKIREDIKTKEENENRD